VPKCWSAEFQISKKSPRIECHNKIGKKVYLKDFFLHFFFDCMNWVTKIQKTIFFVVCEVILIENLRSAKYGPQFSPCRGCGSKQRRGVITPRCLSSICVIVPFWLTACGQRVQSSQSCTWCERSRRGSPFLVVFPSLRPFPFFAMVAPPRLSSLEFERGAPQSVFSDRPSFRFPSLGQGPVELPRGRSQAGNPLPFVGSLATLLREGSPAGHYPGWSPSGLSNHCS
jgi:hypothetical protein